MLLSVVVTTYNQPEWLEKVLWGYVCQDTASFELLVADDGSDARTRALIERMRPQLRCPVLHIWQDDRGFRKCEVLNKAILAASGEALLFTDGDCIPRRDLVSVHARLLEPGRFLSGGYAKLPASTSAAITRADIEFGRATSPHWLRGRGAPPSRALLRLAVPEPLGAILDALTPTRASFNGHNATAWRTDLLRVNGFDERMGWGGLDRELGERLDNAGVHGKQIRHRAHVVHLDHPRGYRKSEIERANRAIRDEVARTRRTWTEYGIEHGSARAG
jgi:glycosyltransferase involved in cell wall biosynthesis